MLPTRCASRRSASTSLRERRGLLGGTGFESLPLSDTQSSIFGILLEAHYPFTLGSSMNDGCRLHISRFPAVSRLPAIGCTSQIVRRLFLLNGVEIPKTGCRREEGIRT